ncbi:MAG: hypothetical protein JNJ50_12160 [Acidobacteria bacterium]|nr:hypothetical protein [Acidobacteriota bacterium]
MMFSRNSLRAFQAAVLVTLLFAAVTDAQAQFDKIRKRIPGMGGSSEVDTILGQIDGVRVKSAYARITLSLADDIIRRQALRNSTKKSTQAQIEKDQKEIEALDRSIVEKRKLLAELGRQTGGSKYDEKTDQQVEKQLKAEEQQRADKRALVDQEIADKERREKELSKQDRENYGKLARILYGAAKQEQDAVETARDLKPRAESAAANTKNSPLNLASTQPKKLNDGVKGLSDVLAEGPQHLATLTSVAQHLAKIGGVDLTDSKFQPKVVTNEDEIPTDW